MHKFENRVYKSYFVGPMIMIHNVYCSYEHVYILYLYYICIFIAIFFQLQLTGIADCESWKVFIKTDF